MVGVAFDLQAEVFLDAARAVRPVVERVWTTPLGLTADESLRAAGRKIASSPGARAQLAGHLFEQLDAQRYNLRHLLDGHVLKLCTSPLAPGYDAFRFIDGRFAGGIQHKLFAASIRTSIRRLDDTKAGGGKLATFRVPSDVVGLAAERVGERARLEVSEFARADVFRRLDQGAEQLAQKGAWATSRGFQTAVAGAKAGGVSALIGGAFDLRSLIRHDMSAAHFTTRRGFDAAEGAATTAITSALVVPATSFIASVATAGAAGAGTAAAILTAPAWVVPAAVGTVAAVGVRLLAGPFRRRVESIFKPVPVASDDEVADDARRVGLWVPPAAAAMLALPALLVVPRIGPRLWVP